MQQFAAQIDVRLAAAQKEPHWEPEAAKRYMDEYGPRRERYEQLTKHLIDAVIRPRVETLASRFANAAFADNQPLGHCVCWLGYCEQFPATTKVEFAVEHDVTFDKAIVRYEMRLVPAFIKFNGQDRLTMPLDRVDEERVAAWVEERLLEFLDSYLQIDRGEADFEEDVATDPVCGMRLRRSEAVAQSDYRGTAYFFCSASCQERFEAAPLDYISFKTT